MTKNELNRLARQILGKKRDMFDAVDDERYEEAAYLRDLIRCLQKRLMKKLLEKKT